MVEIGVIYSENLSSVISVVGLYAGGSQELSFSHASSYFHQWGKHKKIGHIYTAYESHLSNNSRTYDYKTSDSKEMAIKHEQ